MASDYILFPPFQKRITHMGQQVKLGFPIAYHLRLKLLILSFAWSSQLFAGFAIFRIMVLGILGSILSSSFLFFLEFTFFSLAFSTSSSFKFHSHFINAFACQLHDMKTIDDYFCIRETCYSNTKHAVREIHSNLFYCKTLLFRKF